MLLFVAMKCIPQQFCFEHHDHKSPYSLAESIIFIVGGLHIATQHPPSWCLSIRVLSVVISKNVQ